MGVDKWIFLDGRGNEKQWRRKRKAKAIIK